MQEVQTPEDLLNLYAPFFPLLSSTAKAFVASGRNGAEPGIELDAFLQGMFLEGIEVPTELLDVTEAEVRGGWDPELTERTLGWIAKHRQRNQAA
ncbi:hypothetical protein [Trueperella abortisuis]|uniref:hypothetical protein n=1 Tax=Trueperella abortisuis TaxID=445930 RepID=UPI002892D4D5|nr:hypothetical protein [Trueperella abortisuis]